MALEQLTTTDGLSICVDHISTARTTELGVVVGVGSMHEDPNEVGLAHVVEHAVHLRTPQFASKAGLVHFRGCNAVRTNAFTNRLRTVYTAAGPELDAMMWQASEVVCRPIFDPDLIDTETGPINEERRLHFANIGDRHGRAVDSVLFGPAYGRSVVGAPDSCYTADRVQAFYDKYYGYGNMTLLAAGRATMGEMVGLAERYFTQPNSIVSRPAMPPIEQRFSGQVRSGYVVENAKDAHFSRAVPLSPGLRDAVRANPSAFQAARWTLSAHLLEILRNDRGVAYVANVEIGRHHHPDAWRFALTTSVAIENIAAAEDGFQRLLSREPDDYSRTEVRSGIGLIKSMLLSDMDSPGGRLAVYDATKQQLGAPRDVEDEAAEVCALNEDVVRAAMSDILHLFADANNSVTHLSGPREAIGRVDHMVQQSDIA